MSRPCLVSFRQETRFAGIQAQVAARVVQTLAASESMALASRAKQPAPSWADITFAELGGNILKERRV